MCSQTLCDVSKNRKFYNDYKRKVYQENKLDVIEIYPADLKRNWTEIIKKGIYDALERRIIDYTSKVRSSSDIFNPGKPYDMKF